MTLPKGHPTLTCLTPRQLTLLNFLFGYKKAAGRPPSRREMAAFMGVNHNAVNYLLGSLAAKGHVAILKEPDGGKSPGRNALPLADAPYEEGLFRLPYDGTLVSPREALAAHRELTAALAAYLRANGGPAVAPSSPG